MMTHRVTQDTRGKARSARALAVSNVACGSWSGLLGIQRYACDEGLNVAVIYVDVVARDIDSNARDMWISLPPTLTMSSSSLSSSPTATISSLTTLSSSSLSLVLPLSSPPLACANKYAALCKPVLSAIA